MHSNFTLQEWDSHYFNKTIFSLVLNSDDIKNTDWPINSLITTKVSSNNYQHLDIVNKYGFNFIEGEVVFQKKLLGNKKPASLSSFDRYLALESNIDELKSIVSDLYVNSRFREPWFTLIERDSFYQTWVENAVLSKFDDCCLILKNKGNISGFVTIRIRSNEAIIGLIGVVDCFRGQGVGFELLELIETYCLANNVSKIKVATQTSNIPAANLYSKNGFSITDISYWFYKQV
ncbi:GNAT family N-acetyltransferase [Pseudoalteromonas arctica]|uniref:GNAT family N-acetyltransferase n=1 Tax=Pseudoalteromonas arctica TaxID=394751 RepID=UPI001C9C074F|nr:GNAT family N-acetyltransferase [Pseudoalteromonas arctica]MBZ2192817.1 GNAT family N-acetyltransferase [Pseudoalteromonas arctica]